MFKKIVASLLSGVTVAFIFAAPALADGLFDFSGCTNSVTVGVQKGNYYENYGIDVADGRLVSQNEVSRTCGNFTGELGGTVLLSTKGKYGLRGLGDELWVKGTWHPEFETKFGTVQLEGTVVYRALDHSQGLGAIRDDYTELIAGIGYRMKFGSYDVTPCFRLIKANPVGYNNSLSWMTECLTVNGPLPGDARFRVKYLHSSNVNSYTAVIHRNADSLTLESSKQFPGSPWTSTLGVTLSQYGNQDCKFNLTIERDGRMVRKLKAVRPTCETSDVYPYIKLTRAF